MSKFYWNSDPNDRLSSDDGYDPDNPQDWEEEQEEDPGDRAERLYRESQEEDTDARRDELDSSQEPEVGEPHEPSSRPADEDGADDLPF
jgi:hypothetical protein